MSSNGSGLGDSTVNNFSGGAPASIDYIPAIIFTVVLGITLPLLAWRILGRKYRSKILANATMFFLTRLASLILRTYMSKHSYGQKTLIAEMLLMSISALWLVNSLIDLWQKSVEHHHQEKLHDHQAIYNNDNMNNSNVKQGNNKWVKYVATFLRLLLLAALGALIAAGVIFGRRANSNDSQRIIRDLLKASYILNLVTTVAGLIGAWSTHFTHQRSTKKTLFLTMFSIPLLVSGVYRVVEAFTGYRASKRAVAAFWVCMVLFDLIAYGMLLAISIPKWFGEHVLHHHKNVDGAEKAHNHAALDPNAPHSRPSAVSDDTRY